MILREHELTAWGGRIGREIGLPVFIGLSGPLGAGKSVLARAVARGAGVSARLPSPTFGLLFRYPAREGVEVVHADLYRLHDPEEIWELGWEELGAGREIALVEWPHRAGAYLPRERWEIRLSAPGPASPLRIVEISRSGSPPPLPDCPGPSVRRG